MLRNFSYGNYVDSILSYANQTFSVLHKRFLKEIWGDNKTTAKLHHNQTQTNWQTGYYEVYIPTRDNVNYNLNYSRVAIQILPYNSNSIKRQQATKLQQHTFKPLGKVEAELLILIAPHQDKWGLVRGFKHQNTPGYFTMIVTNPSPEIVWKRVLNHIHNFIQKRLNGLMRSLGFETWVWKWLLNKSDNCSNILRIVEHFSYTIRQSLVTFVKLIKHFRSKMKKVLEEIGVQNVALSKTMREIREEITILKKALQVKVEEEVQRDILKVVKWIPNG